VHVALRFIGLVNAAVWLGAAVFLTVVVGPAFFSTEMLSFLPRPYAGRAAEVVLERYFLLQQWCGAIALLHLLVEYLYSRRALDRTVAGLLSALFVNALVGSFLVLPKIHALQQIRYSRLATAARQAAAASAFQALHGVSWAVNLLAIAALVYYLWTLSRTAPGPRFVSWSKFRD